MDVRPTGSSAVPTAALDALQRVHAGASADDAEDSQTAGYLFGDTKKNSRGRGSTDEDDEGDEGGEGGEGDQHSRPAVEVTIDLSAESLAERPVTVATVATLATVDLNRGTTALDIGSHAPTAERHIDIEA
jgi:hypothetical protein